ncbi:MAG: hypothetical protein HKL90_03840 [Elusimicrobia bacterium]|nr:hypothetical protein [Elusimicrobiota bacterium]
MRREVPVFLYAFLIGLMIRFAAVQMGAAILSIVPGNLWLTHPWVDFALRAPFLALVESASFAAIGFAFWSGTDERWPVAGAVTAVGATLCGYFLWGLPAPSRPYLFAVVVASRLAGSFLGPWYGDRTEHDPVVSEIRNMLFFLYPLRLPR